MYRQVFYLVVIIIYSARSYSLGACTYKTFTMVEYLSLNCVIVECVKDKSPSCGLLIKHSLSKVLG